MRYSKIALLLFAAGLVLGLVVVAFELPGLGRLAGAAMAAGIVALPLALVADCRPVVGRARRLAARLVPRRQPPPRSRPARRVQRRR